MPVPGCRLVLAAAAAVVALLGGGSEAVVLRLRGGGDDGNALPPHAQPMQPSMMAADAALIKEGQSWLQTASDSVRKLRKVYGDSRDQVLISLGLKRTSQKQEPQGPVEPPTVVDGGMQPPGDKRERAMQQLIIGILALGTIMIWTAVTTMIASLYIDGKTHPEVAVDPNSAERFSSFMYGPFDCLSRPDISLWVFCCPAIRWADNITTMGLLRSFWVAFAIHIGFQLVTFEDQNIVAWTVLAVIGAMFRQELRLKFQMIRSRATFAQDCLLYCLCPCCAITQEARQVEEAARAGHPAVVKPEAAA